jgi:hypothetical protein
MGISTLNTDADIVIRDDEIRARISAGTLHDQLDYTPRKGMVLDGAAEDGRLARPILRHDARLPAEPVTGGKPIDHAVRQDRRYLLLVARQSPWLLQTGKSRASGCLELAP